MLFEITLPAVVPVSFSELLLEIVTKTAVTCAVIKQVKCWFRLTHLTEDGSLDKRSLPLGCSWLARMESWCQQGQAGHCQGTADDQAESGLCIEINHLFHDRFLTASSPVMCKT